MCSMMRMFNKRISIGRTTGSNIASQNQYVMVVSKAHLAVAVARPNSMGKKISGNSCGRTDRILRGQKPAELPVQTPTKYETRSQPPSPLSRIGSASLPYILPPLLQIYRSLAVKFSSKLLKPIHRTHP